MSSRYAVLLTLQFLDVNIVGFFFCMLYEAAKRADIGLASLLTNL